ncbi:uncharacterized protein C8Q71DRAFT_857726 [Rhodofomes roseus]|uniref:DUF6534 domain-containing protein n=1 Tax=Rhodofomes roseus TaxID=34475 RepID=A0ABQ8KFD1_9APHY|nr:uncharacterized protein C8Q71DRAFT_857726 [Rhodofomes roseus]KAH9836490.1 hypothetical protein C8Q71DRAFT_857726 [Rhodofomes roseus]
MASPEKPRLLYDRPDGKFREMLADCPTHGCKQMLGLLLNWGLLGVLTNQTYMYHIYYPTDRLSLQCLVYGILIFEWVQTGLLTAASFDNYVYNYGDLDALVSVSNSWFSVPVMSAIVALVVQVFYAWRILRLSGSRILSGIIVFLAVAQAAGGIAFGAQMKIYNPSLLKLSQFKGPVITWLLSSILADTLIAVSMTILLLKRKAGQHTSTDRTLDRIVRMTVETGTMTASIAAGDVILCLACPDKLFYLAPAEILSKVYANSLLTNLINRAFVKRADSTLSTRGGRLSFAFSQEHQTTVEIAVSQVEGSSGESTGTYGLEPVDKGVG